MHPALSTPIVACVLAANPAQVADRVDWLKEHAVAVQSIDPEDDEDFSDLMPLKRLIGDARVVMLGEQSHGDGAVFYAKARLIKFLHMEMGFDVLAWESGVFDCREFDRALKDASLPMEEVIKRGVFGIWTQSAQVLPTLEYVRQTLKTDRPIETAGFDHQFSVGSNSNWPTAMLRFLTDADPQLVSEELRRSLGETFIKAFARGGPAHDETTTLLEQTKTLPGLMDSNREALIAKHGEREFEFMRRTADDAVVTLEMMLQMHDEQKKSVAERTNPRDVRMGHNLAWLANERYPNRKIIGWAATFHAVHDIQNIKPISMSLDYAGTITCGQAARDKLGEQLYTIGFTAYDGQSGVVFRPDSQPLMKPTDGSLEDLCHRTSKLFLLIDFRSLPDDHWLRGELISCPLGYAEMKAQWPRQMDAMFYIKTMFPSTRENALPQYARTRADGK